LQLSATSLRLEGIDVSVCCKSLQLTFRIRSGLYEGDGFA
jgi:hypothetical protein